MSKTDRIAEEMSKVKGGFNIVAEARIRALYQLKAKYRPDMTLDALSNFVVNVLKDEAKEHGDG